MLRSTSPHNRESLPNIRSLKLTPKKFPNENKMNNSPVPSSPRYLSRGRSPGMSPGLFGVPKRSGLLKPPVQSPRRDNLLSMWNKSVLGDVQNQSVLGADLSTSHTSPAASKHSSPLPRVLRHNESYTEDSPQSPIASHRHYPTHQTRYEGVGIMPMVRLNQQQKMNTSLNNSMNSPVTIKVAPPDVLKPPPPVFLTQSTASKSSSKDTPSTDSFISAIREKRKRTVKEDEAASPQAPSPQETKRRRMSDGVLDEQEVSEMEAEAMTFKRRAPDDSPEESVEAGTKRSRKISSSSQATSVLSSSSGVRNSIEASFSSSRRWLEKQRNNASRSNSMCGDDRSRSLERNSSGTGSRSSSRHEHVDRRKDLDLLCSATSTPLASCSGRSTPASLSQDELSDSPSSVSKRRPLLLKKGLTKRRLAPLHSDVAESFSRVPQLRYTLTSEEIEQDRQAEKERILRTLDEVEEELRNEKKEKKAEKEKEPEVSAAPSSIVPALTTSAPSISASTAPTSSASKLLMAAPTPSSSSLLTSALKPTVATSLAPSTSAAGNPLLMKPSFPSVAASSSAPAISSAPSSLLTSAPLNLTIGSSPAKSSSVSIAAQSANSLLSTASAAFGTNQLASSSVSANPLTSSATLPAFGAKPLVASSTAVAISAASAGFSVPSATNTLSSSASSSSPFNFGVKPSVPPSSTAAQSNGDLQRAATAPSNLTFGAPATSSKEITNPTFGLSQNSASSAPLAAPLSNSSFSFGNKPPVAPSASTSAQKTNSSASIAPSFQFGATNGTTLSSAAIPTNPIFGQAEKPQPAAPAAFQFGKSTEKKPAASASPFQFGQATSQTTSQQKKPEAASPFQFGGTAAKPTAASAPMFDSSSNGASSTAPAFGAPNKNAFGAATPFGTVNSAPAFGSAAAQNSSSTPFGSSAAPKPSATPFGSTAKPAAPFSFGASSASSSSAPNVNPFGVAQTAASSSTPAFGSTPSSTPAFGSTPSSSTPAFGSTPSSTPAFGSTPSATPFAASNPFGVGSAKKETTSNAFGSSTGASNSTAFGSGSTQQVPSFGAAKGADGGFKFGQASAAPSSFNFGANAGGISRTASAPSFTATPTQGNDNTANNFSLGSNPAVPRRPMAKAARRRPPRK